MQWIAAQNLLNQIICSNSCFDGKVHDTDISAVYDKPKNAQDYTDTDNTSIY